MSKKNVANYVIYGFGIGSQFFLTSFASVLTLVPNRYVGIPLGVACGTIEAITNGTLSPQVTRQLFTFTPGLWGSVAVVFITMGGTATLPLVEGVLQATDVIEDATLIPINHPIAKEILGNTTLFVYGTYLSMGMTKLLYNSYSFMRSKIKKNQNHLFIQMRNYLEDQRSVQEYENYLNNPEAFNKDKYSLINSTIMLLSLASIGYTYGVGPEIADALNDPYKPLLAKALDLFGLIPISDYARTKNGAIVISCIVGAPLYSTLVATTLRTLSRDISFALNASSEKEFKKSALIASYLLFNALSIMTAIFMSIKGGDTALIVALTFFSGFLINYSGAREFYFDSIMPTLSKILCCVNEPSLDENTPLQATEGLEVPVREELKVKERAIGILDQKESVYKVRQNPNHFFCCRRKTEFANDDILTDEQSLNFRINEA